MGRQAAEAAEEETEEQGLLAVPLQVCAQGTCRVVWLGFCFLSAYSPALSLPLPVLPKARPQQIAPTPRCCRHRRHRRPQPQEALRKLDAVWDGIFDFAGASASELELAEVGGVSVPVPVWWVIGGR